MNARTKEALLFHLFTMPWLVGFLIFGLGAMIASLWLSFTDYRIITPPVFIGMTNYKALFNDPIAWYSLHQTFLYAIFAVPLSLTISLIMALLLNTRVKGIEVFRTIFFLPSLLPGVAATIIWVFLYEPNFGLLNRFLDMTGLMPLVVKWFGSRPTWLKDVNLALPSLILMSLWGFGGGMLIFLAGLQGIPTTLYEAAKIDGASSWRCFRHVTMPMLSPVIFFNLIMSIIGAMQVFGQAYVAGYVSGQGVGGPARTTLFYMLYLYVKGFVRLHMGYASAMAWVLFAIVLILTGINFAISKRWVFYEQV